MYRNIILSDKVLFTSAPLTCNASSAIIKAFCYVDACLQFLNMASETLH